MDDSHDFFRGSLSFGFSINSKTGTVWIPLHSTLNDYAGQRQQSNDLRRFTCIKLSFTPPPTIKFVAVNPVVLQTLFATSPDFLSSHNKWVSIGGHSVNSRGPLAALNTRGIVLLHLTLFFAGPIPRQQTFLPTPAMVTPTLSLTNLLGAF